jgi:thiol-disulfide isomerase/thioredoxin
LHPLPPISALILSALVLLGASSNLVDAAPTSATIAPRFALAGRGDTTVALDSLAAKVVLVDFWASWCGPCRKSFPWMNALHEKYGARGLAVVAISLDKERAAADAFLARNPAAFTVAFDPAGKTAEAYRVKGMPSTYLIAPDGTILVRRTGFDPKETSGIEAAIEEALKP